MSAGGTLALVVLFANTAGSCPGRQGGTPTPTPAAKESPAAAGVNPDAVELNEFRKRVESYVALHNKLRAQAPPLPVKSDAQTIAAHQQALARALQQARAGAKHGDLLTPGVEPTLRRIIASELKGPGSAPAKKAVKEGNPKVETPQKPVPLKVNALYPLDAPLSTVPPTLLLKLPKLPEDVLEYRFVGRHLVLRDTVANIIVDYMLDAVP